MGKGSSNKHKDKKILRSKYRDPSRKFLDWVDNLGFEQTLLGRFTQAIEQRYGLRKTSMILLFCVAISYFIFFDLVIPYSAAVGELATTDIKSPIALEMIDEVATRAKQIEAEDSVPPVFDYDPDADDEIYNRVHSAFALMRQKVRQINWPKTEWRRDEVVKDFLAQQNVFEEQLGRKVSSRHFEWLTERRFSGFIENVMIQLLSEWSTERILSASSDKMLPNPNSKLILRNIGFKSSETTLPRTALLSIADLKGFSGDNVRKLKAMKGSDQKKALAFARSLIVPNVTFNKKETSERRQKAREAVLPVQISIKKNQTIVSEGSLVQPVHLSILNRIDRVRAERRVDFVALVCGVIFLVMIMVISSFLKKFSGHRLRIRSKELLLMGTILFVSIFVSKVFLYVTDTAVAQRFGALLPTGFYIYAAPFVLGPMLLGLFISSAEVLWLFTILIATAMTFMMDLDFSIFAVTFIGGLAAARGVHNCEKRNDIYLSGLRAGGVNAVVVSLFVLLDAPGESLSLYHLGWHLLAGFLGGIVSSVLVMVVTPLLESAFNLVTDIKLLELSNLTHPVMQKLMVKAPGTYHHCLVVGSMVEAAAKEIGARPLLSKVMAYYHDIGKMEHAQYFIENQRPGYNPHDHVSPYMSKTIIIAHVKDGAEMAMKHKLGKPIVDSILQHHGTTLISYFYNKALQEQDGDHQVAEENEFRYPGPKPQFRESALVMLADSIEAAARSLDEPTTARLQSIVKNLIKNKFLDGQLEECNLTLKDLSVIEDSFDRTLLAIYHHRIDYPKSPTPPNGKTSKGGNGNGKSGGKPKPPRVSHFPNFQQGKGHFEA